MKNKHSEPENDLRQTNTGRLLLKAMRAFNERSMSAVREMGHPTLSFAHAAILPHISTEGANLSDIASRAGMRKQSASQLIGELEAAGYIERNQDPNDKRVLIVKFTPQGERFLQDAAKVKTRLEDEIRTKLGTERYQLLREILKDFPGVE